MSDLKKMAERLRKSLKLEKGAARRLYGRFQAGLHAPGDSGDLEDWIEWGTAEKRSNMGQGRTPGPNEALRQGNKLAARTQSRRNALTGEREFLLHRGMSDQEIADVHESGEGYPSHTSWTPHYNVAYKFARDYNLVGSGKTPEEVNLHGYVKSAWIPESKIAFVPNQFGDNAHSSEHEVVVHPFRPQYAEPEHVRPLQEKAHLPGSVPPPSQSLKQRLKSRFGKSLAATLESMRKASPVGPKDEGPQPQMREGSAAQQWEEDHDLVLSRQHMPEIWRNHHPELVAGLKPNTPVHRLGGSITPGLRVALHADEDQHVLVKPPLDLKQYKMVAENAARVHQHFLDENFTSSHREAVYHKMAQDFFGLGQYVPRTTVFHHPHSGAPHSAHDFLKGMRPLASVLQDEALKHYKDKTTTYDEKLKRAQNAERQFFENNVGKSEVEKLALMNMVMGNNDRHLGNALVTKDNKLKLIDHGLTLDYGESERGHPLGNSWQPSYARHFWDEGLAPETHEWIKSLDPQKMAHHLGAAGVPAHLGAIAVNRVKELKDWSRENQAAYRAGNQNHQGRLSSAYSRINIHTLSPKGELRPAEEVEDRRKPLKTNTAKLGI